MNKLSVVVKTLVAAAAVAAAGAASATPVIGTVSMTFGLAEVTPLNIDWNNGCTENAVQACTGPASGNYNPPPNSTQTYGGFTAYNTSGSFNSAAGAGLIQDMSDFAVLGTPDANQVNIGSNDIANFLQFTAEPNWVFTLTDLTPGTTVDGVVTPYVLTPLGATSSTAEITVNGTVCDATGAGDTCVAGDDITQWVATLSATYAGYSVSALEGLLTPGSANYTGILPNQNWSGNLVATVIPEPGSLALVGLALAGVGLIARRRKA